MVTTSKDRLAEALDLLTMAESPKCQSYHDNPDEPKCGVIATHSFRCTGCSGPTVLICTPSAEWIDWHMAMRDGKCSECQVPVWDCWVVRPL